jgi:ABC-2 type transport system ATP-binding protein
MIEIRHLTHTLGKRIILNDVNLVVPDGTVMGLVGINGAGKTTLLRLMSGVYLPDSGRVFYDGDREPSDEKTREDIFFLPDDPYYTMNATGKSMREMYKLFYPRFDDSIYRRFLDEYGLDERKPIRNFSKGMRRQLYIAIALAAKPKYLLLDEAFDGLDPLARKSFREAINKYVEEEDTTVIISSHSLRELEDFCDMYALIDNNTVSSSGDIADRVSRLCKFQLAFVGEIPEQLLRALPSVSLDIQGRFVKIIMEGERDECERKLLELSPAVIDEMPMNFEEAFIHEVERKGGN